MAKKSAVSKTAPVLPAPENLDPALTQFIVTDFGEWGRGETIAEALSNVAGGGRKKLEAYMQVWHVTPGTIILADGTFWNRDCDICPVLNESRRKTR